MADCNIIGKLDKKMLDFLRDKNPEFADKINNTKLLMWNERFEHIQKHKMNFKNEDIFNDYVNRIPDIISAPDIIGIREKDSSLQFIKQMDDNILIAIRLNAVGNLSFRTMYPITDSQKNDYLRKGTAWVYESTP